ncbi:hypothetical protein DFP72DRAFT_853357 [Ephemerocybe angulata]|uniref:Uncharacterized protein n=1 Tax=Ephemerocybe angulata TaxID=980116 RepID=A0A8H6M156_9AGAR|nr:hypothetical protein DFP72DRAFT_853357 [Tulosesus angulatus]
MWDRSRLGAYSVRTTWSARALVNLKLCRTLKATDELKNTTPQCTCLDLNALGRSAKVKATKIMGRAQEVLPTSPRPAGQRVSTAGEDAGVSRQRGATGDCQADEEIDGLKDEETEDPYKLDLPFPHQIGEIVLQAMVSVREGRVGAVRPLTPGQKSLSRLKQRLAAERMAEIEAEAQTGEAELEVVGDLTARERGAAGQAEAVRLIWDAVSECGVRWGLRLRACSSASGSAPRYASPVSQTSRALTGQVVVVVNLERVLAKSSLKVAGSDVKLY